MDGWMDGQRDGWVDERLDGCMHNLTGRRTVMCVSGFVGWKDDRNIGEWESFRAKTNSSQTKSTQGHLVPW